MNCVYCSQDCSVVSNTPQCIQKSHECKSCNVVYYSGYSGLRSIVWNNIKLGKYECCCVVLHSYYTDNAPEFIVYYLKRSGDLKEMIHWDFIPNWTPQNVQEKLEKYLTFL